MTAHLTSWSFSRLMDFEECKYRAKLKYIDRVPEPERPLPAGKTEHANDRGSRVHQGAEDFVRGNAKTLIPELSKFTAEFLHLRDLFSNGKVSLEGEWGMDRGWNPAAWKTAWHRSKLDSIVHTSPYTAVVIDYKTGRKFGNEFKHGQQIQLYSLNSFLRFPELEEITTELWYTDQDEITSMRFTRPQGLRFKANFDRRGDAATTCTEFPPTPSLHTCRWCPYADGICTSSAKNATFKGIPLKKS